MAQTISKHIGEGFARGELYAALAYDTTDKFGGMSVKGMRWAGSDSDNFMQYDNVTNYLKLRTKQGAAGVNYYCINLAVTATANDYGTMLGLQAYCQLGSYTQSSSANQAVALYSCIQATGSSSGQRYSLWVDDHSTTTAAEAHYLAMLSQNGSATLNGVFDIAGNDRLTTLFHFHQTGGTGCLDEVTMSAGGTDAGRLVITNNAGTKKYIQLYTA